MSLSEKASSGIKWTSVSQFGRQGMQFVTTAILARFLSPADFGLVSMATVVTGFIALFKDLGTSSAVIQKKDVSRELLSSIFWINIAFGALSTIVLFVAAPMAAFFYHEPRITSVLQVLSLTFFISSLGILQQAIFERNLAFNASAKLELIATAAGSVVGIVTALLGSGVWSLVYQTLAITSATTILFWIVSDWRPEITFHRNEIRAIGSYSINLTGSGIINYFIRNADYMLVGRFLGANDLGYYTLAYRIMLYPLQSISAVIGRVMFPLLSQIQEDDAKFRHVYVKVSGAVALVSFPMMCGLWSLAKPFVHIVFGVKWEPVILLLLILAPVGLAQSVGAVVGVIYQSKGRADWLLRWVIGAGLVYISAFVIGLKWGIVGVAAAYAIGNVLLFYPSYAIPFKLINLPVYNLIANIWRPLLCSIIMSIILSALLHLFSANLSETLKLLILVPAGAVIYLLSSLVINKSQLTETLNELNIKG
jgi:PST family polysaccharide transporter